MKRTKSGSLIYLFVPEPEGSIGHRRTQQNFIFPRNDRRLSRFLRVGLFTGGGERGNSHCPPWKRRVLAAAVELEVRTLRAFLSVDEISRRPACQLPSQPDRRRSGLSDMRGERSAGASARSPFLAEERDVLFHQSCEAFRPRGYLITLIWARLSLFRWTSGILMKGKSHGRRETEQIWRKAAFGICF